MEARGRALIGPPVLVVMGVSGAGKSTLATAVADRFGWPFCEGDDLHPAANVERMTAGVPLTDADRAPWLARVAAHIVAWIDADRPGVITCSALHRAYRDVLRRPEVVFVHPHAPRDLLMARLAGRRGHFMPATLLDSQLTELEPLAPDERAVLVDAALPIEDQVDAVAAALPAVSAPLRPDDAETG